MTSWIGVARVGFGFAACTQPEEAQLPQATIAFAPAATSLTVSRAERPPTTQ
jgi:hypothetical protein